LKRQKQNCENASRPRRRVVRNKRKDRRRHPLRKIPPPVLPSAVVRVGIVPLQEDAEKEEEEEVSIRLAVEVVTIVITIVRALLRQVLDMATIRIQTATADTILRPVTAHHHLTGEDKDLSHEAAHHRLDLEEDAILLAK
jgi:hypothetical protein